MRDITWTKTTEYRAVFDDLPDDRQLRLASHEWNTASPDLPEIKIIEDREVGITVRADEVRITDTALFDVYPARILSIHAPNEDDDRQVRFVLLSEGDFGMRNYYAYPDSKLEVVRK